MSASRQRRLGGLAPADRATTVPPPSAAAVQPWKVPGQASATGQAAGPARRPQAQRQRSAKPRADVEVPGPGKERKAVTVPAPLVERLRQRAGELDRFHTDLVLDCLAATAAAPEHEQTAEPTNATPFHRPRRRAYRGRTVTTLTLYLTCDEVDAMDTLAQRLGLSRSAVVTTALDRALEQLS